MAHIDLEKKQEQELAEMGYNCRVCGTYIHSLDEVPHCIHCKAPVCSKCTSCDFCLNCYLNISEDGRKTLKLLKNLIWFMPIFGILVLIQGWQKFIIAEIVLVVLFTSLYYYSRYQINHKSARYFNPKWEVVIHDPNYITTKNLDGLKPFVDMQVNKQIQTMWKKPSRVDDEEKQLKKLSTHLNEDDVKRYEFLLGEKESVDIQESSKKVEKLKQKKCPLCGEEMEFNEFCVECQRRFCPQCGEDLNPFAERCLCGQKLSPLFPNDDVKGGSISLENLIRSQIDAEESDSENNEDDIDDDLTTN